MPLPRRRSIRLPAAVYREPGRIFSITIATSPRFPVFADVDFGKECVGLLRDVCLSARARVYAYCLMPDHVHLLVEPSDQVSLSSVVGTWKSLCYTAWRRRGNRRKFWQRSYYDHALRTEESLETTVLYVLENPVRAGLVEDYRDYPLVGSFEFDTD